MHFKEKCVSFQNRLVSLRWDRVLNIKLTLQNSVLIWQYVARTRPVVNTKTVLQNVCFSRLDQYAFRRGLYLNVKLIIQCL